jgi:tetratricopeptide (TPR) repeat protein
MDRLSRYTLPGAITRSLLCGSIVLAMSTPARADTAAATPSSTNSAVSYFNACATLYNAGKMEEAIAACDKAIALDPNKADAYFVKGSALFGNGTVDKAGKFEVPPGAVEALDKYLELAPNGAHAPDVHAMLDSLK